MSPVDICAESAEAILALVKSCNDLGERHLPCFVPLFVHAAGLTEADIVAGSALLGDTVQLPTRRANTVARKADDERADRGLSLAEWATEQLVVLGDVYPSACKCKLALQRWLSQQTRSQGAHFP